MIFVFVVVLVFSNTTFANRIDRRVVILKGCNNSEVISDVEYSVKGIKKYADENKIKIEIDNNANKCGYVLVENMKFKEINSAVTDMDLIDEMAEFFKCQ